MAPVLCWILPNLAQNRPDLWFFLFAVRPNPKGESILISEEIAVGNGSRADLKPPNKIDVMKITQSLLALAIAGLLGQTAFADNQFGPLGLAITSNGHGQQHFQYFQTSGNADLSVALYTSSAGGVIAPLGMQRAQADMGNTRLVLGNNQHALANAAYIPTSSHFAPAGQ